MKKKLNIVYEDKNIIVVDKEPHLLTIATDKERERTLYHYVLEYEQNKHKSNRIFIVHRLDKDTSGLVLFAKNQKIKQELQDNWSNNKRYYQAVLEGKLTKDKDIIKSYITENKALKSYSTDAKHGLLAITKYELVETKNNLSLVNIEILTGRKNQIRVHMSEMGNPISGDKKYGAKTNIYKRLALHANKLIIIDPKTKKEMVFESKFKFKF
ncbi:MAG: RNA pseudouridine synthase [Bacilli bacterium]|nr:RNA pseudouridine synthase [Bacilli bacterium]